MLNMVPKPRMLGVQSAEGNDGIRHPKGEPPFSLCMFQNSYNKLIFAIKKISMKIFSYVHMHMNGGQDGWSWRNISYKVTFVLDLER